MRCSPTGVKDQQPLHLHPRIVSSFQGAGLGRSKPVTDTTARACFGTPPAMPSDVPRPHNNRMQSDFGKLALASAADATRYAAVDILNMIYILFLVCGPSMNIGV